MKSTCIIAFLILVSLFNAKAQSIENVNVRVEESKTYIVYDLVDVKENQQVDVKIFAYVRGMNKPIYKVTGDIGKDIIPGAERTIVWNNSEELTDYDNDEITFKVTLTTKQYYRAAKR